MQPHDALAFVNQSVEPNKPYVLPSAIIDNFNRCSLQPLPEPVAPSNLGIRVLEDLPRHIRLLRRHFDAHVFCVCQQSSFHCVGVLILAPNNRVCVSSVSIRMCGTLHTWSEPISRAKRRRLRNLTLFIIAE